jgi:UDP-GlcNAc:polypeptide alpha-N-acetylglucosaminyltransferase
VSCCRPGNAVPFICKATFETYMKGLFSQDSGWYSISEHENIPQAASFVGAGFEFSPATILQDVPFDPYLDFLFHGEEFIYVRNRWHYV